MVQYVIPFSANRVTGMVDSYSEYVMDDSGISDICDEWTSYSIPQEICTWFLLCCALLWLYIDWFSHIHQAYFTGTVLWQSNDCPSAGKATLMNMDKYFMWIHYERLHDHNKAKHNKTVCIFTGIYCIYVAGKWVDISDMSLSSIAYSIYLIWH